MGISGRSATDEQLWDALEKARAARLRPAPGALPVRCPPSPRAPGEPRPHARFQESLWDLAPAAR